MLPHFVKSKKLTLSPTSRQTQHPHHRQPPPSPAAPGNSPAFQHKFRVRIIDHKGSILELIQLKTTVIES